MIQIEYPNSLPENDAEFWIEIQEGMEELYGREIARGNSAHARENLAQMVRHPLVSVAAATSDGRTIGLAMAVNRNGTGHISFLHVLKEAAGIGAESHLVGALVESLRSDGVGRIFAEPLCFCEARLETAFASLGFTPFERALMSAEVSTVAGMERVSLDLQPGDIDRAARVLHEAYRGEPGNELHPEASSLLEAATFVCSAMSGGYGRVFPGYALHATVDGEIAGIVLGCEEPPGIGFVLHLAVLPKYRGRGLGMQLLRDLAGTYRDRGIQRMDLGVTLANPARRLYERLGFRMARPVSAFIWQKGGEDSVYS